MDELVKQAMAKWPHVPDCYGWLGLDARGDWYLRDDAAQAAGAFSCGSALAKGSRLQHEKLVEFIQRNYAQDAHGQWFFQNGPQRVFVELQHTPWVWRLSPSGEVTSHTGLITAPHASYVDEKGYLYLDTPLGPGLVHTADMERAAGWVERGTWQPQDIASASLELQFGFVQSPLSRAGSTFRR